MSIEFTISETLKLEKALETVTGKRAIGKAARVALRRHGENFVKTLVKERLSGRPGLKRRSGDLARSTTRSVTGQGISDTELRIAIGRGLEYAGIQETGGEIKPRRRQYLAIPLPSVQTAAGVQKLKPRDIEGTVVLRTRLGNLLVVKSFKNISEARAEFGARTQVIDSGQGKNKKRVAVPLFLLRKQVFIPPRLGARVLFGSPKVQQDRRRLLEQAIFEVASKLES